MEFSLPRLWECSGDKASDAALENFEELYRSSHSWRPGLSKYSLPRSEASHLLEICAAFGVKGSTPFPDYEGVAREVEEIRLATILG